MQFKKAERKRVFIKIGLMGASGSGKTYTSLLMARGLVGKEGKICVIDTENGSASLYSNLIGDFDTLELSDHSVEAYIKAMELAVKCKYDVMIIDSTSHAWLKILSDKEQYDARGGNSFTNWSKFSPLHRKFFETLLQTNIHVIATMRSKQDYIIEQNEKGKAQPRKIGLAPVQKDNAEYEYSILFDMDMNHTCIAQKDRTGLFDGKLFKPSIETGEVIRNWLLEGKEYTPEPKQEQPVQQEVKPTIKVTNSTFIDVDNPKYGLCPKCESKGIKRELNLSRSGEKVFCVGFFKKECDYVAPYEQKNV